MITHLRLINYRSHADTTLRFEPLSLMVGPVAAGKSNVFKGLMLIQNSIHRSLVELFPPGLGEFHWVRSRWADETAPIGFEVGLTGLDGFDEEALYTLKIAEAPGGLYVLEETLQQRSAGQDWQWVFQRRRNRPRVGEFGVFDPFDPTVLSKVWHEPYGTDAIKPGVRFARAVASALSRFGYYHLSAAKLKSLGAGQGWDRVGYDGDRLPDFLAWTKSEREATPVFERICKEMRQVLPHLESIIVTQTSTDRQGFAMSFAGQAGYVAAPDLSDGTLFTLGLLCVVHSPQKLHLICLEEPETGLHPRRLRWLFDQLMQLAYPGSDGTPVQVLLTTHSPYVVDFFSDMPHAVQVAEQEDGRTRVTPLPKIQENLHSEDDAGAIGHQWAVGLFEGL